MNKCILIARTGPFAGCKLYVNVGDWVVIGRQASRGLSIGDDIYLSREHFRIFGDNGQFRLVDNKSRNGTFLNGEKIDTKLLSHGDCIRAGGTEFLIMIQEQVNSNTWLSEEAMIAPIRGAGSDRVEEATKYLPRGLTELANEARATQVVFDELPLPIEESATGGIESSPSIGEPNSSNQQSLISSLGLSEKASQWLVSMSLEPIGFNRDLYYLFEFKDSNFAVIESFLKHSLKRVRLSLLVNLLELPRNEWGKIRSILASGQGESLAEAWVVLHSNDSNKVCHWYREYVGKDAAIVVGTPILSKFKNQDFTKNGGPLSYPSVLFKTIRKENLVLIEGLLRNTDYYLFENSEKLGSTIVFFSPKFFDVFRF